MKMLRLIDALALCDLANNNITKTVDANDIMRFPTIDAAPVVHGHWITDEDWDSCCSVCGDQLSGELSPFKYCPFCGALMDEVTES